MPILPFSEWRPDVSSYMSAASQTIQNVVPRADGSGRVCVVEVAVRDDLVDQVTEAIIGVARTGKVGDGKIFVTNIERVIRIRTSETDEAAL